MSRTLTPPADDPKMWRRLLKMSHPDASDGDHELFIWSMELKDYVCRAGQQEPARNVAESPRRTDYRRPASCKRERPERIPYTLKNVEFHEATSAALRYSREYANVYAEVLQNLDDCFPMYNGAMWLEQERGASYKRLAAIGHAAGMDARERSGWYRVAEGIPLSDRHAGHILSRLKRRAA